MNKHKGRLKNLYKNLITPVLKKDSGIDAEYLTNLSLSLLSFSSRKYNWPIVSSILKNLNEEFSVVDKRLTQNICGINFCNPIGLAAGFDKNGSAANLWHDFGFGFAELVVAVPSDWIDVQTIADLEEISFEFKEKNTGKLRVATKYPNLTNEFLLSKGLTQYKIVNSLGSTEVYPFTNQSEIITDITSTGATLKANKLRILKDGDILKSSACILVSKKSLRDKYKNELSYKYSPIEKVGVYVPGGTASYPSTVLMNCIPAIVAGVKNIYLTSLLQ